MFQYLVHAKLSRRVFLLLAVGISIIAHGDATHAASCHSEIAPMIKALDERITAVRKSEPKNGSGPQVNVGTCASRLRKLAGNFLCCTTFQNTAPYWEEMSCLELKKFYLRQTCQCSSKGQDYSLDEALQDQALEAVAAAKKLRDRARSKGIANPIIREYVKSVDATVDCINMMTLGELRKTMAVIEKLISNLGSEQQ